MIRVDQLRKECGHGAQRAVVLDGLDLSIEAREISAVVGPSGAGKSTLAQCVSLLERPTSGSFIVNGDVLSSSASVNCGSPVDASGPSSSRTGCSVGGRQRTSPSSDGAFVVELMRVLPSAGSGNGEEQARKALVSGAFFVATRSSARLYPV